ncbi:uncharacterized protein LOC143284616 isoform X2 [Babylonia areolata]|uniref:uncharacterized protein LOC143284616 isoform X2 n=1 Tax=Babylonia areolata TaxID=304850 RepID=UPI003FD30BD3
MASSSLVVMVCVLLITANTATAWEWKCPEIVSDTLCSVGLPIAGGVATVVAAPVVLSAAGFGATGVAAGSLAAKAMSAAWTTGMGAGAVATLQSAGAAGLTMGQTALVGTAGALITKMSTGSCGKQDPPDENGKLKQRSINN